MPTVYFPKLSQPLDSPSFVDLFCKFDASKEVKIQETVHSKALGQLRKTRYGSVIGAFSPVSSAERGI